MEIIDAIILTSNMIVHYHHYKYLNVFLYLSGSFSGGLLGLRVNCSAEGMFLGFSNILLPLSGVRFLGSRTLLSNSVALLGEGFSFNLSP
jgi:hypothetical protein